MIILTSEKNEHTSPTWVARQALREKGGGPFRAPHHTVSLAGVLGELAISAGGMFFMCDAREWRSDARASVFRTWAMMDPAHRPILVVDTSGETKLEMPSSKRAFDPLMFDVLRAYAMATNEPDESERYLAQVEP